MTISPDELYEIIDGRAVAVADQTVCAAVIASRLADTLSQYGLRAVGIAYCHMLFKLPLTLGRNRRPDVAFVPYSAWPRTRPLPNTNAWDVLPTLCVEVVSPTDLAEEVMTKVTEYLTAGVRLVWVVYPVLQIVIAFDSPTSAKLFNRTDAVPADPIVPGFSFRLADLIPTGEPEPTPP